MNQYLIFILAVIVLDYLLGIISDLLNLSHLKEDLPEPFIEVYDADKYRASQDYLRVNTRFGFVTSTTMTVLMITGILAGGFNILDIMVRRFAWPTIPSGLLYAGILILILHCIQLPFDLYHTFVIEERFGFNKTTPKTFIMDRLKSLLITAVLGSALLALVLWIFMLGGTHAWLICWVAVSLFEVLILFLAPTVIMPLFNTFTPLENGPLRNAIESYADSQRFQMKGVFTMDGSKRSSKSNAFFTGFGKSRRIALFDTLIARHTVEELVAVIAHEMGHYRRGHIIKGIVRSIILTGAMFYLLSIFIESKSLFLAFGMEHVSLYAGLILFGFLYKPIAAITAVVEYAISRRHEYEADAFSVETYRHSEAMIDALKKLSADNLTNLTPHPFTVFMNYSHPPVLQRIRAIEALSKDSCGATDAL